MKYISKFRILKYNINIFNCKYHLSEIEANLLYIGSSQKITEYFLAAILYRGIICQENNLLCLPIIKNIYKQNAENLNSKIKRIQKKENMISNNVPIDISKELFSIRKNISNRIYFVPKRDSLIRER